MAPRSKPTGKIAQWRALVADGWDARRAAVEVGLTARALQRLLAELDAERGLLAQRSDTELRRDALRGILTDPSSSAEAKIAASRDLRVLEQMSQRSTPRTEAAPAPGPNFGAGTALLGWAEMLASAPTAPLELQPEPTGPLDLMPLMAAPEPQPTAAPAPLDHLPPPDPPLHARAPEPADQERERGAVPPLPDAQAEQARMLAAVDERRAPRHPQRNIRPPETWEQFLEEFGHLHQSRLIELCARVGHRLAPTENRRELLKAAWAIYQLPEGKPLPPLRPKPTPAEREREANAATHNSRQRLIAGFMADEDGAPWSPRPVRSRLF